MKTIHSSSERGIALIVVLLLMAVMSGLVTGFALTGQVEVQMSTNEVTFAGARSAAEAGLNRAIVEVIANTSNNLIAGPDGLVNATLNHADNADNGSIAFLIGSAGPYAIGSTGQYTYTIEILDDDNDALYETPLTAAQVTAMGEDDSIYTNTNDRLILRSTGIGPNGTTVRIARIIETVDTLGTNATNTVTLSNPAILVNGNFEMNGNITVMGTQGNIHANGNLSKTGGSGTVTGSATASGTFSTNGGWAAQGATGGGRSTVNMQNVQASDYISQADYKLTSGGAVQTLSGGVWSVCSTAPCKATGWTYSGGTWSLSGSTAGTGTYYVEGNVSVSGSPNGGGSGKNATNLALSIIATGSIDISGSPKFTPENGAKIQFITDQDLKITGSGDFDDPTTVEGQIMVRGQFEAGGNMEFQGRVVVQDTVNTDNTVAAGANRIHGSVKFTYNGTLGDITTTTTIPGTPTSYVNNVSGWMEQ